MAIIGGGPAGSTCGTLLRKYDSSLRVVILEKERFPRDHVGESQLPLISHILHEMGTWEKVEGAGFPVKLGATYRWGHNKDLWDFGFMPFDEFRDEPRPAPFSGQRRRTAFHVERSIYDHILLDHAASMGCEVRQGVLVSEVRRDGDRVTGLALDGGGVIEARHYVDASGIPAILARAMGVPIDCPTALRNVAFWGHWTGLPWAVRIGADGTRILVLTIGCGWLWCIPVSKDRTSIGFVCPASYYKSCGKTPEELYQWAVKQEPLLRELTSGPGAQFDGKLRAVRDWSSIADRCAGDNWFLVGDAAGFGDPILSAGLMLSHASARETAYTILEMDRGAKGQSEFEGAWLKSFYTSLVRKRVGQHIRFAEYWYAQNGQFTDLEDYTSEIARMSGMSLSPKEAFRWMSNGGFSHDVLGRAGLGGVDFAMVMHLAGELQGDRDFTWRISGFNEFFLNLQGGGAREEAAPIMWEGRIRREKCLLRGDKMLPLFGTYKLMIDTLSKFSLIQDIRAEVIRRLTKNGTPPTEHQVIEIMQALEVMLLDGWAWGKHNMSKPRMKIVRADPGRGSVVPDADEIRSRVYPPKGR